nr:Crp/Fnr family transcriptional regulator [Pedobacter sp. ASV2]
MIVNENLLQDNGAIYEYYSAKDTLFEIGDHPDYYMQIVEGVVELNNYHEDGKEVTLSILSKGEAVGESLLFSDGKYTMNATAKTNCKILKLSKCIFMKILRENNDVVFSLFRCLSDRLSHDYLMLFNNSSNNTMYRVKSLMDYYKKSSTEGNQDYYSLPLTRQQIANLLGMRVETVIRTIKKMEKANLVKIEKGKIFC